MPGFDKESMLAAAKEFADRTGRIMCVYALSPELWGYGSEDWVSGMEKPCPVIEVKPTVP